MIMWRVSTIVLHRKILQQQENTAFEHMPAIKQMPDIKQIPYIGHIPAIDHTRTSFPVIDKNMPSKNQKRPKWTAYETEEELIESPTFIKDVEEYDYTTFYVELGYLRNKYGFIKVLLKINRKKLIVENEQRKG